MLNTFSKKELYIVDEYDKKYKFKLYACRIGVLNLQGCNY